MVCQDGNIYYSNPQSPDSDGDGLLDGQEITYKADKAVHYNYGLKKDETSYYSVSFKMYSDPMEADTDGDGLDASDLTNGNYIDYGVIGLFREWYILQHYEKFEGAHRPYITYIEFDYTFKGEI